MYRLLRGTTWSCCSCWPWTTVHISDSGGCYSIFKSRAGDNRLFYIDFTKTCQKVSHLQYGILKKSPNELVKEKAITRKDALHIRPDNLLFYIRYSAECQKWQPRYLAGFPVIDKAGYPATWQLFLYKHRPVYWENKCAIVCRLRRTKYEIMKSLNVFFSQNSRNR